jgi:hypothetical protein
VVVAHQHAGFFAVGVEQRLQAGVARQQVVQARAGDEVAVQADHGRVLGVVEAQLVVEHHVGVQAVLAGQLLGEQARKSTRSSPATCARIGGSSVCALIAQPSLACG